MSFSKFFLKITVVFSDKEFPCRKKPGLVIRSMLCRALQCYAVQRSAARCRNTIYIKYSITYLVRLIGLHFLIAQFLIILKSLTDKPKCFMAIIVDHTNFKLPRNAIIFSLLFYNG